MITWPHLKRRGKSGTCACRLILPCRRHTRTPRAAGCPIRYRADFTYYRPAAYWTGKGVALWDLVVEDVKSRATRTKEYLLKRKMLKDKLGIDITEV